VNFFTRVFGPLINFFDGALSFSNRQHDFSINKIINKSGIAIAKAAFIKKRDLFTSKLALKLRKN
jgi:hypothetical protein